MNIWKWSGQDNGNMKSMVIVHLMQHRTDIDIYDLFVSVIVIHRTKRRIIYACLYFGPDTC